MVTEHPLLAKAQALCPFIEQHAAATEQKNTLAQEVVDAFADSGLFHMMVPKELGGAETDVETTLRIFETVSRADGSTGWTLLANASTTSYAGAFVGDEAAKAMCEGKPGNSHAGMFAPMGTANRTDGGFNVSGSYGFGSGSLHSAYLGSGALELHDGEMPPFDERGLPVVRAFFVPRDKVIFKGNWDALGLRGTGSVDYEVPEQFVTEDWTFELFNAEPRRGGAIYRMGATALAGLGHAAWCLGVGQRAMDELEQIVQEGRARLGAKPMREQPDFQKKYAFHSAAICAARLLVYETYGRACDWVAKGNDMSPHWFEQVRLATAYATDVTMTAATFAYRKAGSKGLRNPSILQRCFRDLYTGGQHIFVDDSCYIAAAREMLGVENKIEF